MKKRTIAALVLPAVGVVAAAGVATAAWQSTGSGSASTQASSALASTITAVSATSLFPGASKTALVSVTNPNPYPVVVTSISAGSSSALSGTLGSCSAGVVTSDALNPVGGATGIVGSDGTTVTIPAAGSGTYQLATHMVPNAENGCQGLTFTLPLTATLASNA